MRGGSAAAYRRTPSNCCETNSTRSAMAAFMQRNSSPQPYPYYHYKQHNNKPQMPTIQQHQQNRTPSPIVISNNIGSSTPTPSCSPQAIVIENGRQQPQDTIFFASNHHQRSGGGDRLEKIPLVQKWSPTGGHQTTKKISILPINSARHMGKSMSLDTTVSIAHV